MLNDNFWAKTVEFRESVKGELPDAEEDCILDKYNYKEVFRESVTEENSNALNSIANSLLDCRDELIDHYNGPLTSQRNENIINFLRDKFNLNKASASFLKRCLVPRSCIYEDTIKRLEAFKKKQADKAAKKVQNKPQIGLNNPAETKQDFVEAIIKLKNNKEACFRGNVQAVISAVKGYSND